MKKIIIILVATIALTIGSCKKIDDLNKDSKSATAVPSSTLFANALRNLVDQETSSNVNENVFRASPRLYIRPVFWSIHPRQLCTPLGPNPHEITIENTPSLQVFARSRYPGLPRRAITAKKAVLCGLCKGAARCSTHGYTRHSRRQWSVFAHC